MALVAVAPPLEQTLAPVVLGVPEVQRLLQVMDFDGLGLEILVEDAWLASSMGDLAIYPKATIEQMHVRRRFPPRLSVILDRRSTCFRVASGEEASPEAYKLAFQVQHLLRGRHVRLYLGRYARGPFLARVLSWVLIYVAFVLGASVVPLAFIPHHLHLKLLVGLVLMALIPLIIVTDRAARAEAPAPVRLTDRGSVRHWMETWQVEVAFASNFINVALQMATLLGW